MAIWNHTRAGQILDGLAQRFDRASLGEYLGIRYKERWPTTRSTAALAVRAIRTSRCRAGRRRTAARAQVLRSRDLRGADRTCSCSAAASNGRWETVNALFLSTRRWLATHVAAGLLLVTGWCLAVGGILHVA